MNTADDSRYPGNLFARVLVRLLLVCCGFGLFVVSGIIGALVTLYWLI